MSNNSNEFFIPRTFQELCEAMHHHTVVQINTIVGIIRSIKYDYAKGWIVELINCPNLGPASQCIYGVFTSFSE